ARCVMRRISSFYAAVWDTVHREESPSKSAWHVTCKRCPWTASINSVTRVAQHISGSKTDVKKCTAPDPEMVQLVRQHDASAASAASSTHKRRGEDGMEPSPSRQRASPKAVAPSDTVTAYKALQLLNPGETRFCSVLTMCQRVLDTYPALQAMVCDPRWARWQAAADRPTREAAEKIKNLVLGTAGKHSATWLLHVRQLVSIMEPIRVVLRMMDSSQPVISKVWFALKRMEQAIRAAIVEHNIPNAEQILLATERRTSMLLRPLHGAAALLDPEYRQHFNMRGESSAGQLDFQAVLPDFMKVAEKLSPTSAAECVVQLPKYLHATTAMAAATAKSMPPHEWHRIHTGGALGALAMKVTSQVASATSCERAWSSYGFVHNPRRNRLTASNAEMLTEEEEEEDYSGQEVLPCVCFIRYTPYAQEDWSNLHHVVFLAYGLS
ncbi:hypothetical protein QJQ45_030164, partial [Haematococcus lacustris]